MDQTKIIQETFKGQFLIAMPSLADPTFFQTVTLICEHSNEGAMGIIINRIYPDLASENLFNELNLEFVAGMENLPIHFGGPVNQNQVFVLHGPPFEWEACLKISNSVAMTNSKDIIRAIAKGNGPESLIISLGCAGWGSGQIEDEIMANSWLNVSSDDTVLFSTPIGERWEKAAKNLGIDLNLISDVIGHA